MTEEQQEEVEDTNKTTETDTVVFTELTSFNGWEKFQQDSFSVMAIPECLKRSK